MAPGNLVYAGEPIGAMREKGQHAALDLFIYYIKSIDFDFRGPQTFDRKKVKHEYSVLSRLEAGFILISFPK